MEMSGSASVPYQMLFEVARESHLTEKRPKLSYLNNKRTI
jgi:hypothetical protein